MHFEWPALHVRRRELQFVVRSHRCRWTSHILSCLLLLLLQPAVYTLNRRVEGNYHHSTCMVRVSAHFNHTQSSSAHRKHSINAQRRAQWNFEFCQVNR